MPFSQKVVEDALVACGRRCCLCHKFCGCNMEIHHIVQHADGGPDDFDNAIPLCFDCHADMGKMDPHHPKGRGYTSNELKRHREHWYELVKSGKADQEAGSASTILAGEESQKNYKELLFEVSFALDYYANVYTDIVETVDERHEIASDELRKIGVKIKAFAVVEQPNNMEELKEASGLFIGLSNSMYVYKGRDNSRLLEDNLKREDRIRELLRL